MRDSRYKKRGEYFEAGVGKKPAKKEFRSRGWAHITKKNGQIVSFNLTENDDGFYFASKKVAPLRNWMQAEDKAKQIFREIRQDYIDKGDYVSSYSSMWFESAGGHTVSYDVKRPLAITPLRNYRMKKYTLNFQEHKNIRLVNGAWLYDTIYYAIDWYPTTPITIAITKSVYKNNLKVSDQKLSKTISIENKKEVDKMINEFRQIYSKLKKR
jgi:hypothetical protein